MPHHAPHAHGHDTVDVWSVEGRFTQWIYSPRGEIEGLLIDTDGIATQFCFDRHGSEVPAAGRELRPGQTLVVEGSEAPPSPKGESLHTVYDFVRLVSVDGCPAPAAEAEADVEGTVQRFNYARHGAANGVVLDTGDFIHTRPDGLVPLGLQVGDRVRARGPVRPLVTGAGRVMEARRVNGQPVGAG